MMDESFDQLTLGKSVGLCLYCLSVCHGSYISILYGDTLCYRWRINISSSTRFCHLCGLFVVCINWRQIYYEFGFSGFWIFGSSTKPHTHTHTHIHTIYMLTRGARLHFFFLSQLRYRYDTMCVCSPNFKSVNLCVELTGIIFM